MMLKHGQITLFQIDLSCWVNLVQKPAKPDAVHVLRLGWVDITINLLKFIMYNLTKLLRRAFVAWNPPPSNNGHKVAFYFF